MKNTEEIISGPCFRHHCHGTMIFHDTCYICDYCGIGVDAESYVNYMDGLIELEDGDDYDGFPDFDEVYDEEGERVCCTYCNGYIKWINGNYQCPLCDTVYSREDFFDIIGREKHRACMDCKLNCPDECFDCGEELD